MRRHDVTIAPPLHDAACRAPARAHPLRTRAHALRQAAMIDFYPLARPLLFAADPEVAHAATLRALDAAARMGLVRAMQPAAIPVQVMGLTFPNRVGLAAGLDKNAAHLPGLAALGFGFVEAGTVTARPQPGNPRPRLFRLPRAHALINRLGFNNEGVARFVANVARSGYHGILGINLGRNFDTPNERAADDYVAGLRAVHAHASYVTINVSSPNTRGLRDLQSEQALGALLARIVQERDALAEQHGRRVPLAVKLAPDLADDALRAVAATLVAAKVDAVIATNTTLARTGVQHEPLGAEAGGLSGAPLREQATHVVRVLSETLGGALPIIGVGGILRGADAREKLDAGATLVQLYTGLIYRGPALVAECVEATSILPSASATTTPS